MLKWGTSIYPTPHKKKRLNIDNYSNTLMRISAKISTIKAQTIFCILLKNSKVGAPKKFTFKNIICNTYEL